MSGQAENPDDEQDEIPGHFSLLFRNGQCVAISARVRSCYTTMKKAPAPGPPLIVSAL
jgi:hypothetical protein